MPWKSHETQLILFGYAGIKMEAPVCFHENPNRIAVDKLGAHPNTAASPRSQPPKHPSPTPNICRRNDQEAKRRCGCGILRTRLEHQIFRFKF